MNKRKLAVVALVVVVAVFAAVRTAGAAVVSTAYTGSGTPALAQAGSRLYVAWTGSSGTSSAKDPLQRLDPGVRHHHVRVPRYGYAVLTVADVHELMMTTPGWLRPRHSQSAYPHQGLTETMATANDHPSYVPSSKDRRWRDRG